MAAKRKGAHVSLAKQEVPWDAEKQRRTAATAAIPPPMVVKTEKGQWREKLRPSSETGQALHELPLRLLFVGLNPSELSFSSGYSFGNPTNLFWKLIPTAGIFDDLQDIHPKGDFTRPSWEPGQKAPKSRIHPSAQMLAPEIGIGFTDVGFEVGSRSSKYSPAMVRSWCTAPDTGLYARLTNHCRRVQRDVSIVLGDDVQIEDCAPSILAFTGKKNWADLMGVDTRQISIGFQRERPEAWPACLRKTEIFVLTSSSGAAALTWEDRCTPYCELSRRMKSSTTRFPSQKLFASDPELFRARVAEAWAARASMPGGSRPMDPLTPIKDEK